MRNVHRKSLREEMSERLGLDESLVMAVVDEFMLQLHRRATDRDDDYIGGALQFDIGPQALFHFLYFLDYFSKHYSWEPGTAGEYLLRIGSKREWAPFVHQVEGWRPTQHELSPE